METKKIYVGCTGFNYNSWMSKKGGFYPPSISQDKLLSYYVTQFPTVEINSTYYSIPSKETVQRWAKSLPEGFIITAKLPKKISQAENVSQTQEELNQFLEAIKPLEKNLGPLVLQFSPSFKKDKKIVKNLETFLENFPLKQFKLTIEFRDENWFSNDIFELLNSFKVGIVSSFLPYIKFKIIDQVEVNYFYLRLIGSWDVNIEEGKVILDRSNFLKDIAELVSYYFSKDKDKDICFIYVNNHLTGFAPPTAKKLIKEFEKKGFSPIKPLTDKYEGQISLDSFIEK
ncbi:MAG: DUF72 domain-containing protein [Candidatus Heimdallarchaeaceae archaeon]